MTGFGKAEFETSTRKTTVEIKSLNSKQLDLNLRISSIYKEKEIELRNDISKMLERGKIDLNIFVENKTVDSTSQINKDIYKAYYSKIKEINDELKVETSAEHTAAILRLPEVISFEKEDLADDEWNLLQETVRKAVTMFDEFREQEGKVLEADICSRVDIISNKLKSIKPFETVRIEKIKDRIRKNMEDFSSDMQVDSNRFEQELIYYIEKLDITEEKVRLENHCTYFHKTVKDNQANGKKLGFIAQEIGREINTIGSKANDSDIQKIVVEMKDELEKIKEQLMNIL